MPKRSAKVQKSPALQPPEAGPVLPNPEEVLPFMAQAATIPSIPGKGAAPTSPPRATKPVMRPPTRGFDPSTVQKKRAGQLDAVVTLYPPATARTSVLGTGLIGECAMANGLGNMEPSKVHVGFSEDNSQVFLMPVAPLTNRGVEVSYHQGCALISLWQAFQEEGNGGKVVEEGYREQYNLWRTDVPVTIHGVTGYAVFFSLEHREKERVSSRESTALSKPKKASSAKATAQKGAPEEGQAATAESSEGAFMEEIYDEIAAEREIEIRDLKERLKQYEQKFGKL